MYICASAGARHLTGPSRAFNDGDVRHALCLVGAIVFILWLPMQSASVERSQSLPTDGTAQTEEPSPAKTADFGPQLSTASAGSSQLRSSHNARVPHIYAAGRDAVPASGARDATWRRLHVSPQHRTFPLLI